MEPFQYQRHRMMDNNQNQFRSYRYNPTNMSTQILTPSNLNSLIHTTQNTPTRINSEDYDYTFTRERSQKASTPVAPQPTNAIPNIYPSDSTTPPSTSSPQITPRMTTPNNLPQNNPRMASPSTLPNTNTAPQNTPRMTTPSASPNTTPTMPTPNTVPQTSTRMTTPSASTNTTPTMPNTNTPPQTSTRMTTPTTSPNTTPTMPTPNTAPQTSTRMTTPTTSTNTMPTPNTAPQTSTRMASPSTLPNSPTMTTPNGFLTMPPSPVTRMGSGGTTGTMNIPYSNLEQNTENSISNQEIKQMNQTMTVPQPRLDSHTIIATPPSSSLKSFKTLEECEIAYEKDIKYLNNLNSTILNLLLIEIKKEFDLLDYDGSFIFDEYPDRNTLLRMAEVILERTKNMDIENEAIEVTQFGRNDRNNRDHWLQYLIETLIFHELLDRRRIKRRRGDRYYKREHRNGRYY